MGNIVSADRTMADGRVAADTARALVSDWHARLRARTVKADRVDLAALDREQREAHAFAWAATALAAIDALQAWSVGLAAGAKLRSLDQAVFRLAMSEQLSSLIYGVAIGPNETVRPWEFLGESAAAKLREAPEVAGFLDPGAAELWRAEIVARSLADETPSSLEDSEVAEIRRVFHRFSAERLAPHAQRWHLDNALLPDETVAELAALGAFAITLPSEHGGLGLSRHVMCVVTEELSRGCLAAGSLGTRAEIAGDLIAQSGTPAQKAIWLPAIASGAVLPAAAFTEPDNGSDLGGLRTRAWRAPDGGWRVSGAKTWITHAARSDLLTLLVRTGTEPGHRGLSMLLAPKQRSTPGALFPDAGLEGSEIEVLGYRGMREYALSFEGFEVAADSLLGSQEGQGFSQLMRTFETARIQTAARAVGVAWSAHDVALKYGPGADPIWPPIGRFPASAG